MNGKCAADYSFTRSAQAGTMASKSSVRVHNDHVQVDPQLTFQRLIFARDNSKLEELFRYQLCSYPTSLFDIICTLREPQNPALADALWAKLLPGPQTQPEGVIQYKLNDGALRHRVPYRFPDLQGSVQLVLHLQYVYRKYAFDGWLRREGCDNCHLHRKHAAQTVEE